MSRELTFIKCLNNFKPKDVSIIEGTRAFWPLALKNDEIVSNFLLIDPVTTEEEHFGLRLTVNAAGELYVVVSENHETFC